MARIIYQEFDIPIEPKKVRSPKKFKKIVNCCFINTIFLMKQKKDDFHEQNLTSFSTRVYYYALKEILQITSNFITWAFIFDDYIGMHHDNREETCERVLQIGYGNLSPRKEEVLRPLEALFSEILESIKKQSTNKWQKRFIDSIRNWFVFTNILMQHKMNDTIPTVTEFICYRWFDAASDMFLPQSFHFEIVMQHLVHAVGSVIFSINDIFSYEKETRENHLNLVAAIKNEMKVQVQEAIDKTYDFARAQIQRYFLLRNQLHHFYDMNDEVIKKFINGFDHVVRGIYDYHFKESRYFKNLPLKTNSLTKLQ
ncbi:hypothetical protein B4U79_18450 [Dinothrombium tinctorium]|uniref:Terpene synthase n=1 Tax=Dinothrombium tinctorium TaxID=1965070 RepID=A0A3S4QGA7_9ACAR|nr:hypothetical protein B4U79_18572 [Dinothrombium tinctorium]RWS01577.1 hypothetical protein B4U79_18553 [Dinothrombium tinctorium]RWS03094.1 hypothetical protein B4U79_18450 [Dinothrombium tinctorium]